MLNLDEIKEEDAANSISKKELESINEEIIQASKSQNPTK